MRVLIRIVLTLTGAGLFAAETLTYGGPFVEGGVKPGAVNSYPFPGSADDLVTVEWSETKALNGLVCVQVADSSGGVAMERECLNTSPTNALSRSFRIYRSQAHVLEVSTRGAEDEIPYRVRIRCVGQCTPAPSRSPYPDDPSGPLVFGAAPKAGIVLEERSHVFTVTLSEKDLLTARAEVRDPSRGRACLKLMDPDGAPIGDTCNTRAASLERRAAKTGEFKIVVFDDARRPLAYSVAASCIGVCKITEPPPPPPGELKFGVPFEGVIRPREPALRLSVAANAGDAITINLAELAPATSAQPCLLIRDPAGRQIASRCSSLTITQVVRADTAGIYTVEVSELGNNNTLFFRILAGCSGTCRAGSSHPSEPGRIVAQPSQVDVLLPAGSRVPATIPVQLMGEGLTGSFEIQSNDSRIKVSPSTATLPSQIAIVLDPASLQNTGYSGALTVRSSALASVLTVPISVRFEPERAQLYPSTLALSGEAAQTFLVRGEGPVSFELEGKRLAQSVRVIEHPGGTALDAERPHSLMPLNVLQPQTGTLKVKVGETLLGATVKILPANKQAVRPLATEIHFGGPPSQQLSWRLLHVVNSGDKAQECKVVSSKQWIFLYPQEFAVPAEGFAAVEVQVNTSGQRAAQEGRIEIKCWPRGSPDESQLREAVVRLDVSPTLAFTDLDLSGVLLVGRPGEVPSCRGLGGSPGKPCTLRINNYGIKAATFDFAASSWVAFDPPKGEVPASVNPPGSKEISIRPLAFPRSLQAGLRREQVKMVINGVESKFDINLLVEAGSVEETPMCEQPELHFLDLRGGREFFAPSGPVAGLEAEVGDGCGNPFTEGSVFAIERRTGASVALQRVPGTGRWQGNLISPDSDSARATIEFRAIGATGGPIATAWQDILFQKDRDVPIVTLAGLKLGNSVSPGMVTPGSLVTLEGKDLASARAAAARPPWPTALGGVSVRIAGQQAPLKSVEPERIVFQVPWEARAGTLADVIVERSGRHSTPLEVMIVDAHPEIVSVRGDAGEDMLGAARVKPGENIWIYATGLGTISGSTVTGSVPSRSGVTPGCRVQVRFGSEERTPESVELSTAEVGVFRIGIRAPVGAGSYPLRIQCGGEQSGDVNLEVQ